MPSPDVLLRLNKVSKSYGNHRVLEQIDLDVLKNEFLVVLGPSGSGKTTILRLIGGFTDWDQGDILLEGQSLKGVPINQRPFNTVFQDYALFPHMTVAENVGYGLRVRGTPISEIKSEVDKCLSLVNLTFHHQRLPSELSGGQRQRVALARSIICKPRLILLDEPLAALDASLRRQMQEFLKNIQREISTTFLFITHDQEEAISLADRIVVMDQGRIQQLASPTDLYYRPANVYVANFFGDNNLIQARRVGSGELYETAFGPINLKGQSDSLDTEITIAIRPESIKLKSASDAVLKGCVDHVEFLGAVTITTLSAAKHKDVVIKVKTLSNGERPQFVPGTIVDLHFSLKDTWMVRP